MNLRGYTDEALLSDIRGLIGSQRELTAKLVAHLAEIEERRLHLLAGFPSMFEFCTKELGLSEGEAFRRILASRVVRRFPVVCSLIASGAVHLSALELLRDHLTEENHAELFEAVSGKSKREVEMMLATRFPRPDVPSRIARGRIEPLSETRFRVEFTASAELRDKLELCRDLMSHANPSRDLGLVVERAVDLLLADLGRKRLAHAKRPRRLAARVKMGNTSRAARRQVYERDGTRCTYVSPDGRRCEARAFLELDHAHPRALGGSSEAQNLRVRCRAHNQLAAEQVFGCEHVEERRHFRQRKWVCLPRVDEEGAFNLHGGEARAIETFEKVRQALRKMGFRDGQARRAIAEVERAHQDCEMPAPEVALREAVLAATVTRFG
jgi:5-methylcytosine-specific restriction endonuclease McrA